MNKLKKIVKNKKFVFTVCLVVTILGLLFIVSGTSYALLSGSSSSGNEQIIKTGDVTIALTEHYDEIGNKISILPDSEGLLQEEVYNFNIKNLGDTAARYDIKLINEVPSSYSGPTIEDKYVKVGLEINGEEHGPFTLEEAGNILDSGIIYKNELIEYNLRIWLSEDYEEEILEIDGAKAYFKIEVEAEQSMQEGPLTAADILISKVGTGGLERITHEGDSTLQVPFDENVVEYRYRGATPNNYIEFNDETWRIIGVFPTDDGTGNIENRVKIIRNESLDRMFWSDNLNNWNEASLNIYLNGDYYNSLTNDAQSMIGNVKYYLGGYDSRDITKNEIYTYERKVSGSSYYYGNNPANSVSKLAIMNLSDYGYAVSDSCTETVSNYNQTTCLNNNWLLLTDYNEWIITPTSMDSVDVFQISSDGSVVVTMADSDMAFVRPVSSLKSNVMISGGSGTSSNPYQLSY